jgi:hypothetical protein
MVRINNPNGEPRKSKYLEELRRRSGNPTGKFRMHVEYENPEQQEHKLGILAAKANDCHLKYENGMRQLLPYAQAAGEALIEAKTLVEHGKWLEWLKHNFDASADTAERYMTIARHKDNIKTIHQANPKLTVNEALRQVKESELPEPRGSRATKKVVVMSVAEESRRRLLKAFEKEVINRCNDSELIYLDHYYEREDWFDLGSLIRDDLALAEFLIPSWLHWEKMRKLVNGPQATETTAAYKRAVIKRLNSYDAQRWLRQPRKYLERYRDVLRKRIFHIWDSEPSWSHTAQLIAEQIDRIGSAKWGNRIRRVVRLLNPRVSGRKKTQNLECPEDWKPEPVTSVFGLRPVGDS